MNDRAAVFHLNAARDSRLHFSWGLGPELRLLPIRAPNAEQTDFDIRATRACWGEVTDSNRTISHVTAEPYTELQRSKLSGVKDDAYLARVASYARTVRENLMRLRRPIEEDEGHSQLEAALWHLLEMFFVNAPRHEGNLGEDFVHWVTLHSELLEGAAGDKLSARIENLTKEPYPDRDSDYWPVVQRLVALGRNSEALALLDQHEVMQTFVDVGRDATQLPPGLVAQVEVVNLLDVVIKRQPRMAPSVDRDPSAHVRLYNSLADFTAARTQWLKVVQDNASSVATFAVAEVADKRTAEGVRSVLDILLGQYSDLCAATCSWLELAVAVLVHCQSGGVVSANQLGALLAECQATYRVEDEEDYVSGLLDFLKQVLEAMTDTDVTGVVSVLSNSGLASNWLLAHSLEVLRAYPGGAAAGGSGAGILSEPLALAGCDQMEYFRLAWADSLLPACLGGGWQQALQYLAWCPQHGEAAAEALIQALPVDSRDVRTLERAVATCRRLGLGSCATVLCRMAGVDALSRGQLGSAVLWLVRAADPRRTAAMLRLVAEAVEVSLRVRQGVYLAGPLELPGGRELESFLDCLSGAGEGGGGSAAAAGVEGLAATALGSSRGLAAFLTNALKLSRAMGTLAAAREKNAPPDDEATLRSLADGHSALMSMARRRSPPRNLILLLLFYAIPLLEATGCGGRLFSVEDVQQLLEWVGEYMRFTGASNLGAGRPAGQSLSLSSQELMLGNEGRYARDVQLALVRAMARAHVLQHSGLGGT